MGIGIPPGAGNIPRPAAGSSPLNPQSAALLNKHLAMDGFKDVLSGLNIDPKDIQSLAVDKGNQLKSHIKEVSVHTISPQQQAVLGAMGLDDVELAISVKADDEIKNIKKKLKRLQEGISDQADIDKIISLLGLEAGEDTFVFTDASGGLFILQSGFKEIEESIEEEE